MAAGIGTCREGIVDALKSVWRFFHGEKSVVLQRMDRITETWIQEIKEQDEARQHEGVIKWACIILSNFLCAPNGAADANNIEHQMLVEQMPKLAKVSEYARAILGEYKKYKGAKLLTDLILADVKHRDCRSCDLARERAREAFKVREETARQFMELCFPGTKDDGLVHQEYHPLYGVGYAGSDSDD